MSNFQRFGHLAAAAAFSLALAVPVVAQDAKDYLGVPGPIAFDGQNYQLAWSTQPTVEYTKQEYLPAGQTLDAYQSMVMVEFLASDIEPLAMAKAQVDMLTERKATDPLVNMDLIQNDRTGEVLLDFIVSSKDAAGEYIVEWNAYRYARAENAEGETGGLLFAISHRAYGNAASEAFLKSLRDFKGGQINALATAPLPEL
jgi:hypothetical protein